MVIGLERFKAHFTISLDDGQHNDEISHTIKSQFHINFWQVA